MKQIKVMRSLHTNRILVGKQDLQAFVSKVLLRNGVAHEEAENVARHLVLANLRGVESHGVSRLEIYTQRLECGSVSKKMNAQIVRETPVSALIDGGESLGISLATKGIKLAVQKARDIGMGVVGIKNSNHCGMLADYALFAAEQGFISLVTTNAPAIMPPWGGSKRYFGTNPFCYGIPTGEEMNLIFDMATSVAAKGKIMVAKKNNQAIPLGWALSKEGKPTTDPNEAIGGVLLPVGGPKGYGIAFLVEVLSGVLTGAAFGPYIGDLYGDLGQTQNIGQFFFVMRPDLFMDVARFKERMKQMIEEIRSIPSLEQGTKIYLPGEIEFLNSKEREAHGIPLTREMINELNRVGDRYGVKGTWI